MALILSIVSVSHDFNPIRWGSPSDFFMDCYDGPARVFSKESDQKKMLYTYFYYSLSKFSNIVTENLKIFCNIIQNISSVFFRIRLAKIHSPWIDSQSFCDCCVTKRSRFASLANFETYHENSTKGCIISNRIIGGVMQQELINSAKSILLVKKRV